MPAKSARRPRDVAHARRMPASADVLPDWLRRHDQRPTPPDSLPQSGDEALPVAGHSPATDGGVAQHPVHDEPAEDFTPDDFEQQIEDVANDVRRIRDGDKPVKDRG